MTKLSIATSTLGVPRIGPRRELKTALEAFWSGKTDASSLQKTAADLRAASWKRQQSAGITYIPSNDFSLYDHVLDISAMVGAVPERYQWNGGPVSLATYFAMGRGVSGEVEHHGHSHDHGGGAHALEMTKWFDTNYHYMVPEFAKRQRFKLSSNKVVDEYREAKALGIQTRPVLLGPVSYLKLGKSLDPAVEPIALITSILPVYIEVLRRLAGSGAEWVQIDEPCLVLDLSDVEKAALRDAYGAIASALPRLKVMLTTYFGDLGDNIDTALALPVAGLHVDLVRAPAQLPTVVDRAPKGLVLSLGVIDGRNIWRADLEKIAATLAPVVARRGTDHIVIAPSCSLLHVPVDLTLETDLDPDVREWLAFAQQKMEEIAALAAALSGDSVGAASAFAASRVAAASRLQSAKVHDARVQARMAAVTADMARRRTEFAARAAAQRKAFSLPPFPTTTIGSFPQTAEVRNARRAHDKGTLSDDDYDGFLRAETAKAIGWQEEIGLDVLVHGEFERNDMVQYFGEQLAGFAFTRHGWVQSYGSRCVRPPIIYGDICRPKPMTVTWWRYAQSLTKKHVKGMLTGPVTILNWSFVRNDIPRSETCQQIALAIRDEVQDLETAGATMIQIDEAALREGLPLRRAEWQAYLDWAVRCFRLASSGVADVTQVHTHMCYSEFNDIMPAIGAMDADVISIETSRSRMELLDAFRTYRYPNEIGPGVYDIHSPRVPDVEEILELLALARQRLEDDQLWVNPDCGLKTRGWAEVRPALVNMVAAAQRLRSDA